MQVLKFGGTSVADANAMKRTASIIREQTEKHQTLVVVSALGGMTDGLLRSAVLAAEGNESFWELLQQLQQRHVKLVQELMPPAHVSSLLSKTVQAFHELEDLCSGVCLLRECSERTQDRILSYGEMLSSRIFSAYCQSLGMPAEWVDSTALIVTDSFFGKAGVDHQQTQVRIRDYFARANADLFVAPGFIARDRQERITTLGRGGSDYTAALFAGALEAQRLEIWTDVSGLMTADPRLVPHARNIPHISYQEAMELSHFGAKVIYPPTLQPVMEKKIPVWIRNTFAPGDAGTCIEGKPLQKNGMIRGISSISPVVLLSLEGSGMVGIPGFSGRLFGALAEAGISVILITQASSEHSICVGIEATQGEKAKLLLDRTFHTEIDRGIVNPIAVESGLSILALVGDNMKSHAGTSGKMFGALGRNGINIRAIAQGSSERNISAVIATADVRKAINVLHEEFFQKTFKQINLFIAGTGNVGSRLLEQLRLQKDYLQQTLRLQLRVAGLANSRRMYLAQEGEDLLANGLPDQAREMDLDRFIQDIQESNLRNSVFVDVTASAAVADCYESLFSRSISVVACNKIACSATLARYRDLKSGAREGNAAFLFETNVGAGLPVIGTLNDLVRSGDQVHRIQAVLSGTLNFVFNHYDGSRPFASVVRQAQKEGYTEPDPRLDLGGTDVMRKILILAREAGALLEMEDICNRAFLPPVCLQGSVEDFYGALEQNEPHFRALYEEAAALGKKLKFVASFENGRASVGLEAIGPEHDFYHLYGKDNIVLLFTSRYPQQPLVVKGAGAGAEVTASGVFADIIRAARI